MVALVEWLERSSVSDYPQQRQQTACEYRGRETEDGDGSDSFGHVCTVWYRTIQEQVECAHLAGLRSECELDLVRKLHAASGGQPVRDGVALTTCAGVNLCVTQAVAFLEEERGQDQTQV